LFYFYSKKHLNLPIEAICCESHPAGVITGKRRCKIWRSPPNPPKSTTCESVLKPDHYSFRSLGWLPRGILLVPIQRRSRCKQYHKSSYVPFFNLTWQPLDCAAMRTRPPTTSRSAKWASSRLQQVLIIPESLSPLQTQIRFHFTLNTQCQFHPLNDLGINQFPKQ